MNGINKKPFEMWAARTKLNIPNWLRAQEIKTAEDLYTWCDKHHIAPPISDEIFSSLAQKSDEVETVIVSSIEEPVMETKKHTSLVEDGSKELAAWHTPAAERPLKKIPPRKATMKKGKKR